VPRTMATMTLAAGVLACFANGCARNDDPNRPIRLRLAHVYELKSPTHAFGAAHLGDRVRAADVGLELTVFPAAQLGSEAELLEQLVAGELELAIAGPSFLAMWHPPIGAFDAAYAFTDLDHMLEVAHGEIGQPLWDELRARYGVRVLDTWAYGARHLTANRPIRHPDDLRGFRLRLPAARVWQASGEALGASPMPIAFAEVYLALQQGIADGQENPVPTILAMGFHEVQQYLMLTGHIQSSVQILINERVWQRLAPTQQRALEQAIRLLGEEVYAGTLRQEREILDQWRTDGTMRIVDDVNVTAFRQRAQAFFHDGFPFSQLYRTISSEEDLR
jgi:TRAP-type transport system periplasmic protein